MLKLFIADVRLPKNQLEGSFGWQPRNISSQSCCTSARRHKSSRWQKAVEVCQL